MFEELNDQSATEFGSTEAFHSNLIIANRQPAADYPISRYVVL